MEKESTTNTSEHPTPGVLRTGNSLGILVLSPEKQTQHGWSLQTPDNTLSQSFNIPAATASANNSFNVQQDTSVPTVPTSSQSFLIPNQAGGYVLVRGTLCGSLPGQTGHSSPKNPACIPMTQSNATIYTNPIVTRAVSNDTVSVSKLNANTAFPKNPVVSQVRSILRTNAVPVPVARESCILPVTQTRCLIPTVHPMPLNLITKSLFGNLKNINDAPEQQRSDMIKSTTYCPVSPTATSLYSVRSGGALDQSSSNMEIDKTTGPTVEIIWRGNLVWKQESVDATCEKSFECHISKMQQPPLFTLQWLFPDGYSDLIKQAANWKVSAPMWLLSRAVMGSIEVEPYTLLFNFVESHQPSIVNCQDLIRRLHKFNQVGCIIFQNHKRISDEQMVFLQFTRVTDQDKSVYMFRGYVAKDKNKVFLQIAKLAFQYRLANPGESMDLFKAVKIVSLYQCGNNISHDSSNETATTISNTVAIGSILPDSLGKKEATKDDKISPSISTSTDPVKRIQKDESSNDVDTKSENKEHSIISSDGSGKNSDDSKGKKLSTISSGDEENYNVTENKETSIIPSDDKENYDDMKGENKESCDDEKNSDDSESEDALVIDEECCSKTDDDEDSTSSLTDCSKPGVIVNNRRDLNTSREQINQNLSALDRMLQLISRDKENDEMGSNNSTTKQQTNSTDVLSTDDRELSKEKIDVVQNKPSKLTHDTGIIDTDNQSLKPCKCVDDLVKLEKSETSVKVEGSVICEEKAAHNKCEERKIVCPSSPEIIMLPSPKKSEITVDLTVSDSDDVCEIQVKTEKIPVIELSPCNNLQESSISLPSMKKEVEPLFVDDHNTDNSLTNLIKEGDIVLSDKEDITKVTSAGTVSEEEIESDTSDINLPMIMNCYSLEKDDSHFSSLKSQEVIADNETNNASSVKSNEEHIENNASSHISHRLDDTVESVFSVPQPMQISGFFICTVERCTYICDDPSTFKNHLMEERSNIDVDLACAYCDFKNSGADTMVRHIQNHGNKLSTIYKCPVKKCTYGTNLPAYFKCHLQQLHMNLECGTNCAHCGIPCLNIEALMEHIQKSIMKLIQCPYCSFASSTKSTTMKHLGEKHKEKPRRITVTSRVTCHIKRTHIHDEDRPETPSSGYSSNDGFSFPSNNLPDMSHTPILIRPQSVEDDDVLIVENETNPPATCKRQKGERDIESIGTIKKHVYTCSLCSFVTSIVADSVDHQQLHSGKQDKNKRFLCKECPYSTDECDTYTSHSEFHTGRNNHYFRCSYCAYMTNQMDYIDDHLDKYHCDEEQKYEVKKIGSTTRTESKPKHVQLKKFNCAYCSFTAIELVDLKSHVIQKHRGNCTERVWFTCDECNISMLTKECVLKHGFRSHGKLVSVKAVRDITIGSESVLNTEPDQYRTSAEKYEATSKCKDKQENKSQVVQIDRKESIGNKTDNVTQGEVSTSLNIMQSTLLTDLNMSKSKNDKNLKIQSSSPQPHSQTDSRKSIRDDINEILNSSIPAPNTDNRFYCETCSFSATDDMIYEDHIKSCTKIKNMPKESTNPISKQLHKDVLETKQKTVFSLPAESVFKNEIKCMNCPFTTKVRSNYIRHIKLKHNIVLPDPLQKEEPKIITLAKGQYKCGQQGCKYTAKVPSKVRRHFDAVHKKKKPYQCNYCAFSCSEGCKLKQHVKNHHAELLKMDKPTNSDKESEVKSTHNEAIGYSQIGLYQYKCDYCDYTQQYRSAVQQHAYRVHINFKPFKCSYCDFANVEKGRVSCHIKKMHPCKPELIITRKLMKTNPTEKSTIDLSECSPTRDDEENVDKQVSLEDMKCRIDEKVSVSILSSTNVLKRKSRLKCKLCTYVAPNVKLRIRHESSTHKSSFSVECYICGLCCLQSNFEEHFKKAHPNYVHTDFQIGHYTCSLCSFICKTKAMMLSHNKIHASETGRLCTTCGVFLKKDVLRHHIQVKHENANMLQCPKCPLKVSTNRFLNRHIKLHQEDKLKECTICKIYVPRIKNHMIRVHSREQNKCSFCPFSTAKTNLLTAHERGHQTAGKRDHLVKCEICGIQYHKAIHLVHMQKYHIESYDITPPVIHNFSCNHCPFTTNSKEILEIHMILHSSDKMEAIVCHLCGVYSHTSSHKQHMDTHSDKIDEVAGACDIDIDNKVNGAVKNTISEIVDKVERTCGDKSSTKGTDETKCTLKKTSVALCSTETPSGNITKLVESYKIAPPLGDHMITCPLCAYTTNATESLESHIALHSPGQTDAVVCHLCGVYSHVSSQIQHIESFHSQTIPTTSDQVMCSFCTFTCESKSIMEDHEETVHAIGNKSVECDVCGMFLKKSCLTIHYKSNHPDCQISSKPKVTNTSKSSITTDLVISIGNTQNETQATKSNEPMKIKIEPCLSSDETSQTRPEIWNMELDQRVNDKSGTSIAVSPEKSSTIVEEITNSQSKLLVKDEPEDIESDLRSTIESKIFTCPSCTYFTNRLINLERHDNSVHKSKSKTMACDLCGVHTIAREIIKHRRTACKVAKVCLNKRKNISKKMFKCTLCPYQTERRLTLKDHLNRCHQRNAMSPFICDICGVFTASKISLDRHNRAFCSNKTRNIYSRKVISKKSTFKEIAQRKKLVLFKCQSCPYTSKFHIDVTRHIQCCHIDVQTSPFICDVCGIHSANSSALTRHKTTYCKSIKRRNKSVTSGTLTQVVVMNIDHEGLNSSGDKTIVRLRHYIDEPEKLSDDQQFNSESVDIQTSTGDASVDDDDDAVDEANTGIQNEIKLASETKQCSHCPYKSRHSISDIRRHEERFHGEHAIQNYIICKHCGIYLTRRFYKKHCVNMKHVMDTVIVEHKEENKKNEDIPKSEGVTRYECNMCNFTASKMVLLRFHKKRQHCYNRPFVCMYCEYTGRDLIHAKAHHKAKHSGKTFKIHFKRKDGLKGNENITRNIPTVENSIATDVYNCKNKECTFKCSLNNLSEIKKHKYLHKECKIFVCNYCPYRGRTRRLAQLHHELLHKNDPLNEKIVKTKSFKALLHYMPTLEEVLKNGTDGTRHSEVESANTKAKSEMNSNAAYTKYYTKKSEKITGNHSVMCKCAKFKSNKIFSARKHIMIYHLKYFPYQCKHCDFKAVQKCGIIEHAIKSHSKQDASQVEVLVKRIKKQEKKIMSFLRFRIKKPYYMCRKCGCCLLHLNAEHSCNSKVTTKIGLFLCTFCQHSSDYKDLMRKHISRHIDYLPQCCRLCLFRSTSRKCLKAHHKAKHFGKQYDPFVNRNDKFERRLDELMKKATSLGNDFSSNKSEGSIATTDVSSKETEQDITSEMNSSKTQDQSIKSPETKVKNDISETLFKCTYNGKMCGYFSNRENSMRSHLSAHHTKYLPYTCTYCEYKGLVPSKIKNHCTSQHIDKKLSYKYDGDEVKERELKDLVEQCRMPLTKTKSDADSVNKDHTKTTCQDVSTKETKTNLASEDHIHAEKIAKIQENVKRMCENLVETSMKSEEKHRVRNETTKSRESFPEEIKWVCTKCLYSSSKRNIVEYHMKNQHPPFEQCDIVKMNVENRNIIRPSLKIPKVNEMPDVSTLLKFYNINKCADIDTVDLTGTSKTGLLDESIDVKPAVTDSDILPPFHGNTSKPLKKAQCKTFLSGNKQANTTLKNTSGSLSRDRFSVDEIVCEDISDAEDVYVNVFENISDDEMCDKNNVKSSNNRPQPIKNIEGKKVKPNKAVFYEDISEPEDNASEKKSAPKKHTMQKHYQSIEKFDSSDKNSITVSIKSSVDKIGYSERSIQTKSKSVKTENSHQNFVKSQSSHKPDKFTSEVWTNTMLKENIPKHPKQVQKITEKTTSKDSLLKESVTYDKASKIKKLFSPGQKSLKQTMADLRKLPTIPKRKSTDDPLNTVPDKKIKVEDSKILDRMASHSNETKCVRLDTVASSHKKDKRGNQSTEVRVHDRKKNVDCFKGKYKGDSNDNNKSCNRRDSTSTLNEIDSFLMKGKKRTMENENSPECGNQVSEKYKRMKIAGEYKQAIFRSPNHDKNKQHKESPLQKSGLCSKTKSSTEQHIDSSMNVTKNEQKLKKFTESNDKEETQRRHVKGFEGNTPMPNRRSPLTHNMNLSDDRGFSSSKEIQSTNQPHLRSPLGSPSRDSDEKSTRSNISRERKSSKQSHLDSTLASSNRNYSDATNNKEQTQRRQLSSPSTSYHAKGFEGKNAPIPHLRSPKMNLSDDSSFKSSSSKEIQSTKQQHLWSKLGSPNRDSDAKSFEGKNAPIPHLRSPLPPNTNLSDNRNFKPSSSNEIQNTKPPHLHSPEVRSNKYYSGEKNATRSVSSNEKGKNTSADLQPPLRSPNRDCSGENSVSFSSSKERQGTKPTHFHFEEESANSERKRKTRFSNLESPQESNISHAEHSTKSAENKPEIRSDPPKQQSEISRKSFACTLHDSQKPLCRFYLEGYCRKMNKCDFRHVQDNDKQKESDSSKPMPSLVDGRPQEAFNWDEKHNERNFKRFKKRQIKCCKYSRRQDCPRVKNGKTCNLIHKFDDMIYNQPANVRPTVQELSNLRKDKDQKSNGPICLFYLQGYCKKGNTCNLRHVEHSSHRNKLPDLRLQLGKRPNTGDNGGSLQKRRHCPFFSRGKCRKKGNTCDMLHTWNEGTEDVDLRETLNTWTSQKNQGRTNSVDDAPRQGLCKFYAAGKRCERGNACKFRHSVQHDNSNEFNTKKDPQPSRPCRFFLEGHCKKGNICDFNHNIPYRQADHQFRRFSSVEESEIFMEEERRNAFRYYNDSQAYI